MNEYSENESNISRDLTETETVVKLLEDGASEHMKDLNALILEQKKASTRTKKKYIQKKIDKKKSIIVEYIEELSKFKRPEAA